MTKRRLTTFLQKKSQFLTNRNKKPLHNSPYFLGTTFILNDYFLGDRNLLTFYKLTFNDNPLTKTIYQTMYEKTKKVPLASISAL